MSDLEDLTVTLPPECLVDILQHVPILERVKLRKVCRMWRWAVDNSWSSVRVLLVNDGLRRTPGNVRVSTSTTIDVSTKSAKLAKGLVVHSGEFLRCLRVGSIADGNEDFSVLPEALETCRKLEELKVSAVNALENEQLAALLRANPKVRCLSVTTSNLCYGFFKYVPRDTLEDLSISLTSPGMNVLREVLQRAMLPVDSNLGFVNIRRVIHDSRGLKKMTINCPSQKLLEIISERSDLEHLTLALSALDSAVPFRLRENIPVKWSYIFCLSSLRELQIYTVDNQFAFLSEMHFRRQFITDAFVEGLVQHCALLETVVLNDCLNLTDRSVHALSSLHLKKLVLRIVPGDGKITGSFLVHLVNIEELDLTGRGRISDAGVVQLLRECQTIRTLNLEGTSVTNEMLIVAVEVTKRRTNGVKLVVNVRNTGADVSDVENTSPLLSFI